MTVMDKEITESSGQGFSYNSELDSV